MKPLKQVVDEHGSFYAVAKAFNVSAIQLHRLVAKNATVDDSGAIWVTAKTRLNGYGEKSGEYKND